MPRTKLLKGARRSPKGQKARLALKTPTSRKWNKNIKTTRGRKRGGGGSGC